VLCTSSAICTECSTITFLQSPALDTQRGMLSKWPLIVDAQNSSWQHHTLKTKCSRLYACSFSIAQKILVIFAKIGFCSNVPIQRSRFERRCFNSSAIVWLYEYIVCMCYIYTYYIYYIFTTTCEKCARERRL